jgi:hypothetical protein
MGGEGRTKTDPSSRAAFDSGVVFGAGLALCVVAILNSNPRIERWMEQDSPIPVWPGIVFSALLVIGALIWSARARERMLVGVLVLNVPMLVGAGVIRVADENPPWAKPLRDVGLALAIAACLFASAAYGRRKRELEKAVFDESVSVAFFVTIVLAAAYGILQSVFDLPELSLLWVPVIGGVVWLVSLAIAERKYS